MQCPDKWELAVRFAAETELCDAVLLDQTTDSFTLLCSEVMPGNGFYTRWRRRTVYKNDEGWTLTAVATPGRCSGTAG